MFTHTQKGFTLVEVLVAISLLLMVIVGPLQILTRTNNSTAFATEQLTAWFLAQEGLELAQQARDGYMLLYFKDSATTPSPWSSFKAGTYLKCFTGTGCDIVINNSGAVTVADCATPANCLLYVSSSIDPATGRSSYQHLDKTTASPYTRVITMKQTGTAGSGRGREIAATSTVTWRTGSLIASQKVVTATFLFNIYDTP